MKKISFCSILFLHDTYLTKLVQKRVAMTTIKKIIFFAVILQCLNAQSAQSIYVGKIQFPLGVECPPALPSILYKGREHTIDIDKHDTRVPRKATYELYENRFCQEFYILISEYLKIPNANDFAHLETSDQHPYMLYQIKRMATTKTLVDEHQTGTAVQLVPGERIEYWEITKVDSKNPEMVIPDHTLIFLMDPFFVEVISESWRPDDAIISLPTIKFKDSIDETTLHTIGAKMVCAILDFKCIHKKPTKTTATFAQNRTIAIPNPLNRYVLNS